MSFAWFIYTIALMVVVTIACATSVVSWLLSNRRDSLAAAIGFFAYVLDIAVILFDEYARMKPLGEEYLTVGLTHPIFQVLLNAVLVGSLWAWVVLRLGSSFGVRRVLPVVGGLLVVGALLAPVGNATGPVRTFAYWGFRDVSIIGAFVAMLWRYVSSQQESERADLARLRRPLGVALVLSVAMLAEDATNILYARPDLTVGWISEFLWHLTERNLSENILVLWLAGLSIQTAHAATSSWTTWRPPAGPRLSTPSGGLSSQSLLTTRTRFVSMPMAARVRWPSRAWLSDRPCV